jgi:SAM-dependent methyltransferase
MTNHYGETIGAHNGLAVIDCISCGFAHLDPIPDNRAYYANGFFERDKKDWFKEAQEDSDWLRMCHWSEAKLLATYRRSYHSFPIVDVGAADGLCLLDVGCGFGDFIKVVKELGWDAVGLEPSDYACAILKERGLPHLQGGIETQTLAPMSADAIRLAWVLEHLSDPLATLRKCKEALKINGVLEIIVPNDFTDIQRTVKTALGKGEYWVDRSHINYFNDESLRRLLQRAGLTMIASFNTFPMELFALMGFDYIGNPKLGRTVHGYRKRLELAAFDHSVTLLTQLWTGFAGAGLGRDLVRFAVRTDGLMRGE